MKDMRALSRGRTDSCHPRPFGGQQSGSAPHNSVMPTPFIALSPQRLGARLRPARHMRSPMARPAAGTGRWRPGVSSYRVFVTIVFAIVVLTVGWSDQHLPAAAVAVVGSAAVTLWVLTLLGSLGIGPVAGLRDAIRR